MNTSMIMALLVLCAVFGVMIFIQVKIIREYKYKNAVLRGEINNAAARLEHIRKYINRNKKLEEAAKLETAAAFYREER